MSWDWHSEFDETSGKYEPTIAGVLFNIAVVGMGVLGVLWLIQ